MAKVDARAGAAAGSDQVPLRQLRSKGGDELSPEVLGALAAEAEAGYDLGTAKRRRVGRPPLSARKGPARRLGIRVEDELADQLKDLARRQNRDVSEVAREALRRYVASA